MKKYISVLAIIYLSIIIVNFSKGCEKSETIVKQSVTLLMEAAATGDLEQVKKLLIKTNKDINAQDAHGRTALYWAAQNNQGAVIEELLKAETVDLTIADNQGFTPFDIAVDNGNFEATVILLKHQEKDKQAKCECIEKRDKKLGYTPLMRAAHSGNESIVKLLLEHGANPTLKVKKGGKLLAASDLIPEGYTDIAQVIENKKKDLTQNTYLFRQALEDNQLHKAKMLLFAGIDIDAKNGCGVTPLHNAAYWGHVTIVEELIKAKACVEARANDGDTPLHNGAYKGCKKVVAFLIKSKADVNAQNNKGETPLYNVAYWGHIEIAKILIDNKADVNVKTPQGKTPLDDATSWRHEEIVKLLKSAGAK